VGSHYFELGRYILFQKPRNSSILNWRLGRCSRKHISTTCSAVGSFFIDRDPSTFGYALEYLRKDDLLAANGEKNVQMQVYGDAVYFQLQDGVKDYLRWSSLEEGIVLSFSEFSFLSKEL